MRMNGHGIPVVALDIDGTLADYHRHFLEFAEKWIGKRMPPPGRINPGKRLSEWMEVEHSVYQECKLAFRQGGLKRWMPAYGGVQGLTWGIRDEGAEVWICTTRPYLRLDNIDPDTREWLARNRIHYDAVLFGEQKYAELRRQAGDRVVAVFDDLPEQCDQAVQQGFDVWVRDQPYNRHYTPYDVPADVRGRVYSCSQMFGIARRKIRLWKDSHVEQ